MTGAEKLSAKAKRILVVDDDHLVRASILDGLATAGFEILEADNGQDCIRILSREFVDAIVLDIIMPEMEGLEVITRLRKTHPNLKIVAVSGGGRTRNTDILKAANKLGADVTLNKPFDPIQLIGTVRSLLGLAAPSDGLDLFPTKGGFAL
ncbi:MAG: response regulator [Rhodospirillaceae bacterium]